MKYVVIFNDDSGKPQVKNKIFEGLLEAEEYADTIDESRKPTILPYVKMYPESQGEFTCDDFDEMAKMVEEVRLLLLFSSDTDGASLVSQHHMILAMDQLSSSVQNLKLASLFQAEAMIRR